MALFEKKDEKSEKALPQEMTLPLETLANRVLLRGRVTEKSYLMNAKNQYVFHVAKDATKTQVKRAVEAVYGVHVKQVRTISTRGKLRMFGRVSGFVSGIKKAIVTLPEGEEITFFKGA